MRRFLSSPRRRRRAAWIVSVAAGIAAIATVIALLPNQTPPPGAPTVNEGPADVLATVHYRLTKSDRRGITHALSVFIPNAVGRRDPAAAWAYAGSDMKSGSTLAEWRAGSLPVPSYPVGANHYDGWQALDVGRDSVDLDLLVQPRRGAHLGAWVFSGQAVKSHGRWLIDTLYTKAMMTPPGSHQHEVGPADFAAPSSSGPGASKPALGHAWVLPVVLAISLVILIPLGLGIVVAVRGLRWRRRVAREGRTELPPLPSSYRRAQ